MDERELTPEQAFSAKIDRQGGIVRMNDLVAFAEAVRARQDAALRVRNVQERDADWHRGKAAFAAELLNILRN